VFTTVPVAGSEPSDRGHRVAVADMDAVDRVRERATAAGGAVRDIRTVEPSLERVFLDLAGAGDDDEEPA
jgi:ABC-2 type transport system ATP-binding protein